MWAVRSPGKTGTHYDSYEGHMYVYRLPSGYFSVAFDNRGAVTDWHYSVQG